MTPSPDDLALAAGARALAETAGARWLDDVVLRITGSEAMTWIQGQVTCDTRGLDERSAVYGLVLEPKGRILTDGWISREGDAVMVALPSSVADAVVAHLERYVIMEDVEVRRGGDRVLSVQGARSAEVLRGLGEQPAARAWRVDRLGAEGYDLVVQANEVERVTRLIDDGLGRAAGMWVTHECWELARIRAGIPAFGADFDGASYVQEAGLGGRAVSFSKGCYLGQEVVVMLEHRGRLTRRLVTMTLEIASGAAPGTSVVLVGKGDADPGAVGAIRSAARDPVADCLRAFAYVKRSALEAPDALRVNGVAPRGITIVGPA